MERPENKTEFFYTESGLVTVDSPVKLQILNLLREDSRSFDEIVKYTAKAKSTISVHLNNLRASELLAEMADPADHRRKIYSLSSHYMGCSQKPVHEHYNSLLGKVAENGINDRFSFMESVYHALRFGFEAYGIDNVPIVKKIGCDIGFHLSSAFESGTPEELLEEVGNFLESGGNGRLSMLKTEPLSLLIEDPFKAESMPVIGKPFCALSEGIIEGILCGKLGREFRVQEKECYGTGHGHCMFEILVA